MGDGLSVADAMALVNSARNNDCCCNDGGMWGTGGFMWIFFLFFLMAWGNNGSWFGNRNAVGDPAVQGALTRSDLFEGFNNQEVINKLDAISHGVCDSTYALNNTVNNLGTNVMQGFNGVDRAINNLGYEQQQCCCTTQRAIDQVRFDNSQNTCSIIDAVNASSQRIIDQMTQDKMDDLRTQLQSAQLQLSNNAQTANLIATLRPFPQPAYITCSPYTSVNSGCCQAYCGVA